MEEDEGVRGRNCVSEAVSDTTIFSAFNNDIELPLLMKESSKCSSHCTDRLILFTISSQVSILLYNSPVVTVLVYPLHSYTFISQH